MAKNGKLWMVADASVDGMLRIKPNITKVKQCSMSIVHLEKS